jgi:hypothetical protein
MKRILGMALIGAIMIGASAVQAATVKPKRVQVTGEIVDSWCYVTEIMYALGTAHHRCAIWCAAGGIPVSLKADDGTPYVILRVEGDGQSVANPKILKIQTHQVTVDGDLYERDGVKYLIVNKVADDNGVVNLTHEEYGVQP